MPSRQLTHKAAEQTREFGAVVVASGGPQLHIQLHLAHLMDDSHDAIVSSESSLVPLSRSLLASTVQP